jgi:hypothetical protein
MKESSFVAMLLIVPFFIFILMCPPPCLGGKTLLVGDFSTRTEADTLPEHWQPLLFDGIENHTVYTHVVDEGLGVIQAIAEQSSSGLVRKISIDVNQYPQISFRWKIDNILQAADLTRKQGDDAPARVYVTFAYDSSMVSFWERVKFAAIKLIYGEYPPIGALTYVWASHGEKGTIMDNPYTSRVKMVILESGGAQQGQWLSEQRDIQADYKRAFGSTAVPRISGVAIMTDTDNTGERAVAWYGDIIFSD